MQQQVDGHLRPQQRRNGEDARSWDQGLHELQHEDDDYSYVQSKQKQQRERPSENANQQPLENHSHTWQRHMQQQTKRDEPSSVRGSTQASQAPQDQQPSQFIAWPGGATLASALWNAQEKVVHHIKQLQLLENPFAPSSSTAAASEASPRHRLASSDRINGHHQLDSPHQQQGSKSPSPSALLLSPKQTVTQTSAAIGREGARDVIGDIGKPEAPKQNTSDELRAAAAAAAALDVVPLHTVTAQNLVSRCRNPPSLPAPLMLGHDTTLYRLVTFANGRPHHVHHVCSPPPHPGGRSLSTPGKTYTEDQRDEQAPEIVPTWRLAEGSRWARDPGRETLSLPPPIESPTAAAGAGAESGKAAAEEGLSPSVGDSEEAGGEPVQENLLPAAVPAVTGEHVSLDARPTSESNAEDDTSEGGATNRNSSDTSGKKLVGGEDEAKQLPPAAGDLGAGIVCTGLTVSSAPFVAAGRQEQHSDVTKLVSNASDTDAADLGALSNASDTDAVDLAAVSRSNSGTSACATTDTGTSVRHRALAPSGGISAGWATSSSHPTRILPKADHSYAKNAADATSLSSHEDATRSVGDVSGHFAWTRSPVYLSNLSAPVAACDGLDETESRSVTADARGTAALLQLVNATNQLSSVVWKLLFLCVLLPLAYFSLALPPEKISTALASGDAAGPPLPPGSSCVPTAATPGFLVHALITVYILVVGNAAWNLWRLRLPHDEMFLYGHLGGLLSAARRRERRGDTRPLRGSSSAAAGTIAPGEGHFQSPGTVRRTVSAVTGYGGGYSPTCYSVGTAGGGGGGTSAAGVPPPAAASNAQGGGAYKKESLSMGSAAEAFDVVDRSTDVPEEVLDADECHRKGGRAMHGSRKQIEEDNVLSACISSFPSSASVSTSSDITRVLNWSRNDQFETAPPPCDAPPPPASDWPQWPVLLRATQESWLVHKTHEVQQQLNRLRRRSMAGKHGSDKRRETLCKKGGEGEKCCSSNSVNAEKEYFIPTLRYPLPPLLFMTPDILDPRKAVVSFETPFFRGRVFICIPSPGTSVTKKQQGPYGKRAMHACVQCKYSLVSHSAVLERSLILLHTLHSQCASMPVGTHCVFIEIQEQEVARILHSLERSQCFPAGVRAPAAFPHGGQFLQPYRVGEVLTGQAFFRPLRSLPPQWMVNLGLKVAKQLTSTLQEDIFARMPYFLTPAVCSVETLHVAHSARRRPSGNEQRREHQPQAEQCKDDEEEYISPPDVTLLDVPEETRLLGGPFARGGISPQQRKSMLGTKELLQELTFDPELIYTFNFIQNIFYPSTYEFDLGVMKLDLSPFLNQQPIEVMAIIDDTFVRDSSPSSKGETPKYHHQKQKHHMQPSRKKTRKKQNRKAQESEVSRRQEGEQEKEGAGRNRLEDGVVDDDAKAGSHGGGRSSFEEKEEKEIAEGFLKEASEDGPLGGEEDEGEDEEDTEIVDADPRLWVPPANGRKFAWQFQMWHAKLLDKPD